LLQRQQLPVGRLVSCKGRRRQGYAALVHLRELSIGVFGLGEGFVALPLQPFYLGVDQLGGAHRFSISSVRSTSRTTVGPQLGEGPGDQ
jgi:hypothetical protein